MTLRRHTSRGGAKRAVNVAVGCAFALVSLTGLAAFAVLATDFDPGSLAGAVDSSGAGASKPNGRPGPVGVVERITRSTREAVFLLESRSGKQADPACASFAVRPELLVTTASCVVALERERREGAQIRAVAATGDTPVPVKSMWRHPGFEPEVGRTHFDAGLVQLSRDAAKPIRLTGMARVATVRQGQRLYVHGFDGLDSGNLGRPRVLEGHVLDVSEVGDAQERAVVLAHDVRAAALLPGAPVFNGGGALVGVQLPRAEAASQPRALRLDVVLSLVAGFEG